MVSFQLPTGSVSGKWQQMDLIPKNSNAAAKTDIMPGDAAINSRGIWPGQWEKIANDSSGNLAVQVATASATILHFAPMQ